MFLLERECETYVDNITFDHNLFLLHKFTQEGYNKNSPTAYDSCIIFSQIKDQQFIRPPIEAPHLTLNIKECNPDKDIHATQPTIQLESYDVYVFNYT
jgi:hypothetical protein